MSTIDNQSISEIQYFEELKFIILSIPSCTTQQFIDEKKLFGKDISKCEEEIEYIKQAETSISQLKNLALFLGNKIVEVRQQHMEEIENFEVEIMHAKEEIQEQKQKLQEYYQVYQSMEEKNLQYEKLNFELEEQCESHLQKLSALYQTMEAAELQRIQNWNMTQKNNSISMQQLANEREEISLNPYRTISLQLDGRSPREDNQADTVCNSCSDKQIIIDQLQKELHSTNLEKHALKDKLSNIQEEFENLEKKLKKEEKVFDSINLNEKFQHVQKQRIFQQKGKDAVTQNFNHIPEKIFSPCSSIYNTNEDENIFSSQQHQNQNYKLLIDELNQIKQKSTNNPNDIALSDYQNSQNRQKSKTKDYLSSSDQNELKQYDFIDYFNSSNKKFNCVSQFSIPLNQQSLKNAEQSNKKNTNFLYLQKKNSQSESPSPCMSNKHQIQTKTNQDNFLNKLIKPIPFSQIEFNEFGIKQNLKVENEIKSQNNKLQSISKELEQIINKQNSNKIDHSLKTPTNNQQVFTTNNNLNSIHINNENQNAQFKVQLNSSVDNRNKVDQAVQVDLEQISSYYKSSKKENSRIQLKNVSEQHIQQPLFDDLKDLVNIKDSQEFNIMFSKDVKISQNNKKQKQQTNFSNEYDNQCDDEEEKKEYIQSDQFTSEQIYNQNGTFKDEIDTEQSQETQNIQIEYQDTKNDQHPEKVYSSFQEKEEEEEEEEKEQEEQKDNQIQNNQNSQKLSENNTNEKCKILKYSDKPKSIWIKIKQWVMLFILLILSKIYGIFFDKNLSFLESSKQ